MVLGESFQAFPFVLALENIDKLRLPEPEVLIKLLYVPALEPRLLAGDREGQVRSRPVSPLGTETTPLPNLIVRTFLERCEEVTRLIGLPVH